MLWRDLFSYDVLLYDLTSTYSESDPPFPEGDKRRFGYSSDHRPDCVQLGEQTPTDADPKGEWYAFEKGATKTTGGEGWADVWKRGCLHSSQKCDCAAARSVKSAARHLVMKSAASMARVDVTNRRYSSTNVPANPVLLLS